MAPRDRLQPCTQIVQTAFDEVGETIAFLEGTPLPQVGRQIFEEIVAVASGKRSKSELSGVGEEEFAPWIIEKNNLLLPAVQQQVKAARRGGYRFPQIVLGQGQLSLE